MNTHDPMSSNVKIIGLMPVPERAAYLLTLEAGGSPITLQVDSDALISTMMALFNGELNIVIHFYTSSGITRTELVKARAA